MRKYEKPAILVMDLQLKENIAAVPTTVYKGATSTASQGELVAMALSESGTGLKKDGELVIS